jgi:hypothetical protein
MTTSALLSGALCDFACTSEALWDEFRLASTDAFESGLKSLSDGLIEGLFAVFQPDTGSASSASSASGS